MIGPHFLKLNEGWNAEPNAPAPIVTIVGSRLILRFFLNPFRYSEFAEEDVGIVRLEGCARYRLGPTNDEGWSLGQCRYSRIAPAWGEFYELIGDDPLLDQPQDWLPIGPTSGALRHFLFYFRDETFECLSVAWKIDPDPLNKLRPPGVTG